MQRHISVVSRLSWSSNSLASRRSGKARGAYLWKRVIRAVVREHNIRFDIRNALKRPIARHKGDCGNWMRRYGNLLNASQMMLPEGHAENRAVIFNHPSSKSHRKRRYCGEAHREDRRLLSVIVTAQICKLSVTRFAE